MHVVVAEQAIKSKNNILNRQKAEEEQKHILKGKH
jgi:hypothetical protein